MRTRPDLHPIFTLRLAAAALALLGCAGVRAAGDAAADERAAIRAERQRLEASFAAEEARCRERFAVTGCVDDVHRRRRAALAVPRARELALIDAERKARADARREAVARKQREAAERPIGVPEPAHAPHLPPAPRPAAAPAPAHAPHDPAPEAARRAAASQHRQDKLEATRERIAAREAERRTRKPAAPLPVPAASAAKP